MVNGKVEYEQLDGTKCFMAKITVELEPKHRYLIDELMDELEELGYY